MMVSTSETNAVRMARMEDAIERLIVSVDELKEASKEETREMREDMKALQEDHRALKARVDLVVGNVRSFGAGMAASFTLIGTAIGIGIVQFTDLFK